MSAKSTKPSGVWFLDANQSDVSHCRKIILRGERGRVVACGVGGNARPLLTIAVNLDADDVELFVSEAA